MSSRQIADDTVFFFRKTPFLRLLLALLFGIVFQVVAGFYYSVFLVAFWFGIGLMLSGYLYRKNYRFRWFFGLGVTLWLFSVGLFLTQRADENTQFRYIGEQHTYLAKIVSLPRERPRSVLYELRLISNIDNGELLNNKVLVYLAKDSLSLSLETGERILVNAAFEKPRNFGNPYEFNYPRFLKRKGVSATSFVPAANWQQVDEKPPFSIVNLAMKARNKLLSIYQDLGISGNEFGVLAALTLGYREELSQDLRASYQAAGVAHVLAVSGMHVGIIFIVLDFMLGFMNRKRSTRILKALIIITFLLFYSFITGLPPSVVRSAMMLSIVVISRVVSRKTDTYNTVFLCAFFMLIYNPYYLFDIGFQMSYLAVLGIVFYQSKFQDIWKTRNKLLKPLWALLTVSLAAQLVTTPLSLYYFNYFPNYFWISNIIIVPMVSWVIYLACGLFLVYQIPVVNELVATLLTFVLRLTNDIIIFVHHLPYSQIENIWLDGWQLGIICLIIAILTIAVMYRHGKSLIVGLLLIAVLFSVNSYAKHQTNTSGNRMLVAAMQEGYGISFVNGATSYLLTDNDILALRSISPYLMKNRINQPSLIDDAMSWYNADGFVFFGGKRILILSSTIFEGKITEQPLELDYLILTNNLRISMSELMEFVSPRKVIIDQSYRSWVSDRIKYDCERLGINSYVIGEEGAFLVEW
ncbi:MAG: ComEC family competence protein [Dysgonamonadaceae bacterium]|jgi:competence protein ComEC|nr:ComEC family competence protein [Dysgonamonadaceae bacterium]